MMHAIKGGWVGHTFALAACSDSGGRKARIRRSKEERKGMVESFIKKYQSSNNGKFPSLNLTHKEVGGSFYTVREIVREIIQENRVLGPAKFSEEQSYGNVLEHYPLGSISIEAQRSSLPSDEPKSVFHTSSKQSQRTGEEIVANSNGLFVEYEHQNLASDQVVNGVIETVKDDMGSDGPKSVAQTSSKQSLGGDEELVANFSGQSFGSEHQKLYTDQVVETIKDDLGSDECSLIEAATHTHESTSDDILQNLSGQLTGPDCQEFDSEPIGNVSEPTDEDEESNEPIIGSPVSIPHPRVIQEHHKETREEQVVHSTRDFPGDCHLKADKEKDVNGISQAIGENEYEQPVLAVAVGEDSLDVKKGGAKTLESSNDGMTHGEADIVVEKFPLRPIARKFDDLEGRSGEQSQGARTLEVNKIEQDRVQVTERSCSVVQVEAGADLAASKNKSELMGKTASLNDGNAPLEMSNSSTTKNVPVFDISNAAEIAPEIGAMVSSPIEAKPVNVPTGTNENLSDINASVSHEQSIPDETTGIKDKLKIEGDSSSKKGSNSTLNRINLETWERTSEMPAESEVNPVLAFFKAFVTAFVRFWSE